MNNIHGGPVHRFFLVSLKDRMKDMARMKEMASQRG